MANLSSAINWTKVVANFKKHKIHAFNRGEREYELSVATGNLLYRFTIPDCVAQPENAYEVGYIIKEAKRLGTRLTVKCGGHSYTGFSQADQGILMDLKRMNEVHLDLKGDEKQAVVSAGARWGDVYRKLIHSAENRGWIINGGRCPPVGVSGFLLGGGLGPFTRRFGMGSDGITQIKMVDVNGEELVIRNDKDYHKDLFWALRGAGCANFGVVTEFTLKAHRLSDQNGDVVAGRYTWMPFAVKGSTDEEKRSNKDQAKEDFYKTMTAFYKIDWPPAMTIDTNWMMDVKGGKGEFSIRFNCYFDGNKKEFDDIIQKYIVDDDASNPEGDKIVNKDLKDHIIRRALAEPSTRFLFETLVLMWEEEARFSLPRPGDNTYQKYASFCFTSDAANIDKIVKIVRDEQDAFEGKFKADSASLWVTFIHSGGQASAIKPSESAFPWRGCVFQTYVTLKWTDKWLEAEATAALLSIKTQLHPYSMKDQTEEPASFINFSDATLGAGQHEKAYYGANYKKVREQKAIYDKTGFFKNPWDRLLQLPAVQTARAQAPEYLLAATTEMAVRRDSAASKASDEVTLVDDEELKRMAEQCTDVVAAKDWDTFTLPPENAELADIYGRQYVDDF